MLLASRMGSLRRRSMSIDPNVKAVQGKLAQRARVGLAKYGTDTTRKDLTRREWLQHAQDEAMDLAVYLERLIREEDGR